MLRYACALHAAMERIRIRTRWRPDPAVDVHAALGTFMPAAAVGCLSREGGDQNPQIMISHLVADLDHPPHGSRPRQPAGTFPPGHAGSGRRPCARLGCRIRPRRWRHGLSLGFWMRAGRRHFSGMMRMRLGARARELAEHGTYDLSSQTACVNGGPCARPRDSDV